MKKERFVAFFDAVMAIIMTIVVLEFVIPNGTLWEDLEILAFQIIAYAVSFFWLGGMWINIHGLWHDVKEIDRAVLWVNLATLFFSSMIPFFTVYFGRNITAQVPAFLYATDVLLVTLSNGISVELLSRKNDILKSKLRSFRISFYIDIFLKVTVIVVGATVFPPAILISVVVSTVFLSVYRIVAYKKKKSG